MRNTIITLWFATVQFSNGQKWNMNGNIHEVHTEKLDSPHFIGPIRWNLKFWICCKYTLTKNKISLFSSEQSEFIERNNVVFQKRKNMCSQPTTNDDFGSIIHISICEILVYGWFDCCHHQHFAFSMRFSQFIFALTNAFETRHRI